MASKKALDMLPMGAAATQTVRVTTESNRTSRGWGAGLLALGILALGLDARWGVDSSGARSFLLGLLGVGTWAVPPEDFLRFASHYAPGFGEAPFDLSQSATLAGWVHLVCALALGARLGPRLLRRVDRSVGGGVWLGVGSACALLFATSPWLALFLAERNPQSAPGYLGLVDLVRGAGVTMVWVGAGLLWGTTRKEGQAAPPSGRLNSLPSLLLAIAVGVFAPLLLSHAFLADAPLTNDGVAYQFQAELFAEGELHRDIGLLADFFPARQILPGALATSKYPPGHSFVLAPGTMFGIPRLLPALFAGWTILLTWLLARRLCCRSAGAAAWMVALSPMFLGVEALWLSHGTSIPMCALFFYAWISARDRASSSDRSPLVPALVAGAALSLAFAARPMTALAFAIPCGVEFFLFWTRNRKSASGAALLGGVAGFLPGLLLFYSVNAAITGSGFKPAYSLYAELLSPNDKWGLSNLGTAFPYTTYNLARLSTWLGGFGFGFVLLLLGWRVARPAKFAYLVLSIPVTLLALYSLHRFQGIPWVGPLYLVEAVPLFALVASGGLLSLSAKLFGPRAIPAFFVALLCSSAVLLSTHLGTAKTEAQRRAAPFAAALNIEGAGRALFLIPLDDAVSQKRFPLPPPAFHADLVTGALVPGSWPIFARDLGARNRDLWQLLGRPPTWLWSGSSYREIVW
jgi:hypothetical protein